MAHYPQLTADEFAAMVGIDWTVLAVGTTAPPGSPADGDAYVVGVGATGAWVGADNKVAIWQAPGPAWLFVPTLAIGPTHKRLTVIVDALSNYWRWTGTAWQIEGTGAGGGTLLIENRNSDPVSPATGRIWLRTDL